MSLSESAGGAAVRPRGSRRAAWIGTLAALAALGCLAFVARGSADGSAVRLAYAVERGTKLDRAFDLEHHLVLSKLEFVVDGVAQSSHKRLDLTGRVKVAARDEVRAVSGGRPTLYARAFQDGGVVVDVGFQDSSGAARADVLEAPSLLAGTSVLHTWSAERGDWGRCYDQRETSEEFLEYLENDFDLLGLLPPGPVAVGAEWDVDPANAARLFAPVGDQPLRLSKPSEALPARAVELGVAGQLGCVARGPVTGRARARVASLGGEGAESIVRIAIEFDLAVERDQTERARALLGLAEALAGVEVRSARTKWSSRGTGTLAFDRALGTFGALDLVGSETVRLEQSFQTGHDGPRSEQVMELSGGLKLRVTTAAVKPKSPTPR